MIPCIYDKVTYQMLVKTFLETWMYAILLGRIEIHIESGDESAKLDNGSITDYVHFFMMSIEKVWKEKSGMLCKQLEPKKMIL